MLKEIRESFQTDGSYMKFFLEVVFALLISFGLLIGFAGLAVALCVGEFGDAKWCALVGWALLGVGAAGFKILVFGDEQIQRIAELQRKIEILEVKAEAKNFEARVTGRQSRCEAWDNALDSQRN